MALLVYRTSRALLATALLGVLLALHGCVTAPPAPPPPPTAPPPPPPSATARFDAVAWTSLPGWASDRVEDAWPAFQAGCAALVVSPTRQALWQTTCAAAASVDARNQSAVRSFFETHFIPYQIVAADGSDTGLITGYYEPLLSGSRFKSAEYAVPLYAVPDDLLIIDMTELFPELKDKRMRGRVEGRRVVPYWPRADIEAGRAQLENKVLVYVDDPVEAFFLQIQGSGRGVRRLKCQYLNRN